MEIDKDFYVEQDKNFALGNFINCTPTIRYLSALFHQKIQVYFTIDHVKQCFTDCPFMEIIGVPNGNRAFGSNIVCPDESMPDYQYVFKEVVKMDWSKQYHTYIDIPKIDNPHNKYVLFINGTGSQDPDYVALKDPESEIYNYAKTLIPKDKKIIFTGNWLDYKRNEGICDDGVTVSVSTIRTSLALIKNAIFIISNDTGLAHAAGAMNKPILILWKDTKKIKNMNCGKYTEYAYKDEWRKRVKEYIINRLAETG